MTGTDLRILTAADEARLFAFLEDQLETGLFLYSNVKQAGLEDRGAIYQGSYAACIEADQIVAVAAHFWNGMLLVQGHRRLDDLASMALSASGRPLTGVLGAMPEVADLSRSIEAKGHRLLQNLPQDFFTLNLEELLMPSALSRDALLCRRPRSSEVDLLCNWRAEQEIESFSRADGPELRRGARQRIEQACREKSLWVLERKGRLVANCELVARAGSLVQVGNVRTLPAYRNRGFARAVVAGALARLRDEGVRRAVLFSHDAAAKRAYRALGFEKVGDLALQFWERCDELVA